MPRKPPPSGSLVSRDHLLFAVIGLLVGFITGYLLHETMAARQAAPRTAGAALDPGDGTPGPPGSPEPPMEAINRLRRHVEENPRDAEAVLLLANMNFEIRNWPRARELYTQYLGLDPENPDVITDLGVCHRELGEFKQALELFARAQALAPEHWQSRYNEVVVLAFDLDRPDAAAETLQELQRLQPENPSVAQLAEEVARRRGSA